MQTVCVFCGSNSGADPAFAAAAAQLGALLAANKQTLVYGGGHVGLMGVLADAALAAGGRVIGVIPQSLAHKELAHAGLTELRVVASMHERKALMADLSDGFIALPGGIGTLEELFEIWTWGKLGLHVKPYGLLNIAGFFDPLLTFLDQMTEQNFLSSRHRQMLLVHSDPRKLLDRMAAKRKPAEPKWIDRDKT